MMYREKLMPGPGASSFGQIGAMQMRFASGSAEIGALFEELNIEKILLPVVGGMLTCHCTFRKGSELMVSLRGSR